jgi:hypothetical protein
MWKPDLKKYDKDIAVLLDNAPPLPPVKKDVLFAAKTVRQAQKEALELNLADKVSYSGINVDVANEWNLGVSDSIKQFPPLRERLKFIGTIQDRNKLAKQEYIDRFLKNQLEPLLKAGYTEDTIRYSAKKHAEKYYKEWKPNSHVMAVSLDGTNWQGISLNTTFGKSPEAWRKSLKRDVESKFHPVGCDSIKYVIDHEIGHQIDDILGVSIDNTVKEMYNTITEEGIKGGLSNYANKNIHEFVAEAWAEYRNNATPRPIAAKIGAIIDDKIASYLKNEVKK